MLAVGLSPSRPAAMSAVRWPAWLFAAGAHVLVLLAAWRLVPLHPSARYLALNMWNYPAAHFLVQYDSLYFVAIAQHGYLVPGLPAGVPTVFFPWVPLLLAATRSVWVFLALQAIAFGACCWLVARVAVRWQSTPGFAAWAVWLFALNPALVYYSAPYAELWTMLGALAAVEWWCTKHPGLSALVSVGTALTQASGLLVGIIPLTEAVSALKAGDHRRLMAAVGWGMGLVVGVGLYMGYLGWRFGHPLWFSTEEGSSWWHAGWVVPGSGLWAGVKLAVAGISGYRMLVVMTLLLVVGLVAAVVRGRRATDPWVQGVAWYAVLGILLPMSFATATHPLHSTVRLLSDYFPAYLGLAALAVRYRGVGAGLLALFVLLGGYGSALYLHGVFFQ